MEHMWLMRRPERLSPATKLTAAALVVLCTASVGMTARADSISDQKKRNDRRIAALGQQLEGTNASLARAYVNLQRTNAALPVAQQHCDVENTKVRQGEVGLAVQVEVPHHD